MLLRSNSHSVSEKHIIYLCVSGTRLGIGNRVKKKNQASRRDPWLHAAYIQLQSLDTKQTNKKRLSMISIIYREDLMLEIKSSR